MTKLLLSSFFETVGAAAIGGVFGLGAAVCFGVQLTWEANYLWLLISLPLTFAFILTHKLIERN